MVNVVCMKWGTAYGPEYVNILYAMTKRHLSRPFRFACFTDNAIGIKSGIEIFPLPDFYVPPSHAHSPWRKISLLSRTLGDLKGPTLFLDLDVVIVDSIDCFFDAPGDFCIIENWTQMGQGIGNSSVFRYNIGAHTYVVDYFNTHRNEVLNRFDNSQTFMSKTIGHLIYWDETWVRSFKQHCIPKGLSRWFKVPPIPAGAKIIAFHGNPKPPDATMGKYPGKWFRDFKPTPWIPKHWRDDLS